MKKIVILGFLFFSISACTKGSNSAGIKKLVVRIDTEPPMLDYTKATDTISRDVNVTLQVGLVMLNREEKPAPNLAESWEISKDLKTYTFKLRPNLKWSDGTPMVAQNFVDAIEYTLNPTQISEYAYFLFDIAGAEDYFKGKEKDFTKIGAHAIDAQTVQFTLRSPAPYWINIPAFPLTFPVRKDLIEKYGNRWTDAGKLVSSGPYVLKSYERDSRLQLVKNPNFWDASGAKDSADEIDFRVIKEGSVAVTMFDRGEIDIMDKVPPMQVSVLAKTNPGFKKFATFYLISFGMGMENPLTKDRNVRLALAKAVDREEIRKVLDVGAEPVQAWVPNGLYGSDPKRGIAFDPAGAKKIWAALKNPPKKLEFWCAADERQRLLAEFLQGQWKKNLGIQVELVTQEWKVYLKTMKQDSLPVFRVSWAADYPDANNYLDLFECGAGNNFMRMCNKKYDGLVKQALNTPDQNKRGELYGQAEKILLEDEISLVPVYQENTIFLINPKLKNFFANRFGESRLVDVRF